MSNRRTLRHIGFAILVATLLVACATVDSDDRSEHVGRVSSALGTEVCLGGADTPSLVPKWSQIYLGRWASSSVVSGTVQNTDTIDIPVRIDLRMAGADARVISTTLWQGTLARGSTQTVSFRLETLPIRSYNVASAAEIVATATGTPRRGDSVYSDPLYAIYGSPNRLVGLPS